jgi:hypothetical protein
MKKQTFILALLALAACRNPKTNEQPEQRLRDYPKKDTTKGALYATESPYPRTVAAGVPFMQHGQPKHDKRVPKNSWHSFRNEGRTVSEPTEEIKMYDEN